MKALAETVAEALHTGRSRLAQAGHTASRLEVDLLLSATTGLSSSSLFAWGERVLSSAEAATFDALLRRREHGEPIAQILGRREFWSLDLKVTADVLIPRPETELLVEIALQHLPALRMLRIADLGTGSGAIAAALARERPNWSLIGVERSAAALAVAAVNRTRLGLEANLSLLRGHWLDAVAPAALDAILANPPYIRDQDPCLLEGDLPSEPISALKGGADGLDAIRAITAAAPRCLRAGGLLALEHGWDQGRAVRALLRDQGLTKVETRRDLAGQERVTVARAPSGKVSSAPADGHVPYA